MTAVTTYSFSRVSTFEQCPRRYRYRYVDGVREAFRGVEAFMGQQVHAAIEWLFSQRLRAVEPGVDEAVRYYCGAWDRALVEDGPQVRVIRGDGDLETYRRTGAEMVARFWRERFSVDRLETIAVEQAFSVQLGGTHSFRGFIDRLARDREGRTHLIDYKTGRRAPSRFSGKEADQVRAYAVAWFLNNPCDEIDLVLDFLQAGKLLRERVYRTDAAEIERSLVARIGELGQATVFPPNPGALCEWCGFNDLCEAYVERGLDRAARTGAVSYPRRY